MHCPHCGKDVDATDAHCRHCGGPLAHDASAIDKLVEDKARAVLAAEREQAERLREDDAARQAEAAAKQRIETARRGLASSRARREQIRTLPRPFWRPTAGTSFVAFVLVLPVGLPSSCIAEGATGHPVFGALLCPTVCHDCTGPGRVISYHVSTNGNGGSDESRALCDNPRVDVHALGFAAAIDEHQFNDIELSGWKRTPLWLLAFLVAALLVVPFFGAWLARRALVREARDLDVGIEALARIAGADPLPASQEPYR